MQKLEDEICRDLLDGKFCSVIGPHRTGQTALAHAIIERLKNNKLLKTNFITSYIDLYEISSASKERFYSNFAVKIHSAVIEDYESIDIDPISVLSGGELRVFLTSIIAKNNLRALIVIDHLEGLPEYLAKSLLECFRVLYVQQSVSKKASGLMLLAVGTLPIGKLTSDQTSPFISSKYILQDSPLPDARRAVRNWANKGSKLLDAEAVEEVLRYTGGDSSLLKQMQDALETQGSMGKKLPFVSEEIREVADEILKYFHDSSAFTWARYLIEREDPNLELVARLIAGDEVRLVRVPMDSYFELSGIVLRGESSYHWRSQIWKEAITNYYSPSRFAEIWSRMRCWDLIQKYVAPEIRSNDLHSCRHYLKSSVDAVSETMEPDSFANHILDSLSPIIGNRRTSLILTNQTISKIEGVYVRNQLAGSDAAYAKGVIHLDRKEHLAIKKTLLFNRPFFSPNTVGMMAVAFPINFEGKVYGVLNIENLFQEKDYKANIYFLDMLSEYLKSIADIAIKNRECNKKQKKSRNWYILALIFMGLFLFTIGQRLLQAFTGDRQAVWVNPVVLGLNALLLFSLLATTIIYGHRKMINDLVQNILSASAVFSALILAITDPGLLLKAGESLFVLLVLFFVQILLVVILFRKQQS